VRAVPPFPFYAYDFPIDKMRHWIELQRDRAFTAQEAQVATGLDASSYLRRLGRKGEVERLEYARYRRTDQLWLVDFEQATKRFEDNAKQVKMMLHLFIEVELRALVIRLHNEAGKLCSVEVKRCAAELEAVLDKTFK
jgi:hypothetical protein